MSDEPVLRPWRTSDAPALLRHYRSSADIAEQVPTIGDVAAARALIESWSDDLRFALVLNGVAIGQMGVSQLNRAHQTGWMSWWIAPSSRGHGWMKRAACTVADWAFFEAPEPLFRLELGHRVDNHASARIAEAAGFVVEGIERQKLRYGRLRYDARIMSRLQTDPRPRHEPLGIES